MMMSSALESELEKNDEKGASVQPELNKAAESVTAMLLDVRVFNAILSKQKKT